MPDPNWFFSTMAQSSAAIVGLLGAILISKMIDHGNSLKEEKNYIVEELKDLKRNILAEINLKNMPKEWDEDLKATLTRIHMSIDHGMYDNLEQFKLIVSQFKEETNKIPADKYTGLKGYSGPLERVLERYKLYNSKLLPRSFNQIFYILAFLSIVGVITPIYFLSGFNPLLFALFIVAIILVFIWFFWQLNEFKKNNSVKV